MSALMPGFAILASVFILHSAAPPKTKFLKAEAQLYSSVSLSYENRGSSLPARHPNISMVASRQCMGEVMIIIPCSHLGLHHTKNSIAITSTNLDKKPDREAGILSPFHMRKLRYAEVK